MTRSDRAPADWSEAYGTWVEAGFDPAGFWMSTPRLIGLTLEARARAHEREHNGRAWLAWNTAALQRVRRMPPLKSMLARPRKQRAVGRQSVQEMIEVCRMWTAAYGGVVH